IRVELTAGGGGNKSVARRKKLEEKKKKLSEERRRIHETYIAPTKSKSSNEDGKTSDTKLSEKIDGNLGKLVMVKKPRRLKGSNAVKPNKIRNFGG
ncbi:7914_t:CDS:2, partial [Acaulospora colombiana]